MRMMLMCALILLFLHVLCVHHTGSHPTRHHNKFSVQVVSGIPDPSFKLPVNKVVVAEGHEAVFICRVKHLADHKVVWIKFDTEQVLTYHLHVIIADQRFRVNSRGSNEWLLTIKNVTVSDRGLYMCQINTDPPAVSYGELDIVIPPKFIDNETSSDLLVQEGEEVRLRCAATGNPTPNITWQRLDSRMLPGASPVYVHHGTELHIPSVGRHDAGMLQCVASNGVIPSVSRKIGVKVTFPPSVFVSFEEVGSIQGGNASLECRSRAYPAPVVEWYAGVEHINPDDARRIVTIHPMSEIVTVMRLVIINVTKGDYANYKCKVSNPVSKRSKEGIIQLFEIIPTTTTTTTTTTTAPPTTTTPTTIASSTLSLASSSINTSFTTSTLDVESRRIEMHRDEDKFSKHHKRKDIPNKSLSRDQQNDSATGSRTSSQGPSAISDENKAVKKSSTRSTASIQGTSEKFVFQGSWFRLLLTLLMFLVT